MTVLYVIAALAVIGVVIAVTRKSKSTAPLAPSPGGSPTPRPAVKPA